MNNDCIFCKIIQKQLSSYRVYEDQEIMAFLDNRPLFPGHTLVIPKLHIETIFDLDDVLAKKLFQASKYIAIAVQKALGAEGIFIGNNNIIGQTVPHFHLHVVPRNKGDGLKGFFWPRHPYSSENEIKETQEKIKHFIKVPI